MAALFQLSYSPREVVVGREVYRRALIVPGRLESQVEGGSAGDLVDRYEKAPVEITAVGGDRVDLLG
ncbi:MAG: hypothetical protein U0R51_12390 [Solirubrobacterales bacterium]